MRVKVWCVAVVFLVCQSLLFADSFFVASSGDSNSVTKVMSDGSQTVIASGKGKTEALGALPNGNVVYGTDYAADGIPELKGSLYMYDASTGNSSLVTGGFQTFYDLEVMSSDNIGILSGAGGGAFGVYNADTDTYLNLNSGHGGPMGEIEPLKTNGSYTGDAAYSSSFGSWSAWLHEGPTTGQQTLLSTGFGNIDALGALNNGDVLIGGAGGKVYSYSLADGFTIPLSGYDTFYYIEGLSNGNALIASSISGGVLDYYDAAAGTATNIDSGIGAVEVMKALPNGGALFGTDDGSLYKYNSGTDSIELVTDGLGSFVDMEILADGTVVFGASVNNGTVYGYDISTDVLSVYGTDWGTIEAIAVPEPATIMMFGIGGLLLRRKKK